MHVRNRLKQCSTLNVDRTMFERWNLPGAGGEQEEGVEYEEEEDDDEGDEGFEEEEEGGEEDDEVSKLTSLPFLV
jgi:hypothetical protein